MNRLKSYLRRNGRTLAWLADQVGRSRDAVKKWKRVPVGLVLTVEAATGGEVTRYELRPDIYPDDLIRPFLEASGPNGGTAAVAHDS